MHFDIIEAVRQKQHKHQRSISIENGDVIDLSMNDGKVVVRRAAHGGLGPQEDAEPPESGPLEH